MSSLRWGIIGTGWIANEFTRDLVENGFTVSAIGSRSLEKARGFADRFGIPTAHGSYSALVADPEVDVVYIATPHPMHVTDATLALEAGKHVLVEKAFTVNAVEAQQLVDLAASKNLVVLEAMWTRFLPHMVRLRELLAAGAIGEVRTVIADHSQSLPSDPAHRVHDLALGGGALLDLGIYVISFAFEVLGEPERVLAISSPTSTGADAETSILLGFSDGRQAVLHCSLDTAGPNRASVTGTAGWVEVESVFYSPTAFTVFAADGTVVERYESDVTQRGMQYQAWELERLVAAGQLGGEILPPAETVAIMRTLDEVRAQIGLKYPGERRLE